MLFTESVFLTQFLPIALIGFLILQAARVPQIQSAWLIIASIIFYAWFKIEYLPLLVGSLFANYLIAALILRAPGTARAKKMMIIGIIGNLALLGTYKYLGFVTFNLNALFAVGLPSPEILLPLGISFFTFQQISYLVDAHCGKLHKSDHRPLDYMLFVTFFPQLVAGPIVHHEEMMPQFRMRKTLEERVAMFGEGAFLLSVGLFKKLVIADSVAPVADQIFNLSDSGVVLSTMTAWTGALAYTFQIYFDFSGYSDMAIGLGLMFAIRLPWNFNSPYKATNISEFWRRWHMSLSRWLRDYLYIPMGGNRKGTVAQYRNNFLTMVLGGLWHGAHWNFIIWGALHGVYLIINQVIRFMLTKIGMAEAAASMPKFKLLGWACTFLATVVAWVFFRATSTQGAFNLIGSMVAAPADARVVDVTSAQMGLIAGAALVAFLLPNTKDWSEMFSRIFNPGWLAFTLRTAVGALAGAAAAGAFVGALSTTPSPFLYFNF